MNADDSVRCLREALWAAPDDLHLRQHLADLLLDPGRAAEAEQEYCTLVKGWPGDGELILSLAMARNYATYANESGIYDDVLRYLNQK